MTFNEHYRKLFDEVTELPTNGNGRIYPPELRKRLCKTYYKLHNGNKGGFCDETGINVGTFSAWRDKYKIDTKAVKVTKAKSLSVPSVAAKGRSIGSSLEITLSNYRHKDVLQQVAIVDALGEAGYKQDEVIEKMNIVSRYDFKQIMDAVRKLSEDYTITKKEIT